MISYIDTQSQYKKDIFRKLNFTWVKGKTMLDVGCGDCTDAQIFIEEFKLKTFGMDVFEHKSVKLLKKFTFKRGSIYNVPFKNNTFDYVFSHDVLHHIDEPGQDYKNHIKGLLELKRVTKKGGVIIIVEGNRYNPLFYPHMVRLLGHAHFKQSYFKKIISDTFDDVEFKFFESHLYPKFFGAFWCLYDYVMDRFSPRQFLAYNVAIIKI